MLETIHIEDLGVIESADLSFSPGLTALTGETGAGKTMVLTSLGLLLGQRAEAQVVRGGARRTLVEGSFLLPAASRPAERAGEAGAEMDDDVLLASRCVPASGRSRAHLGGRAVPSSVLAEVGADLVSVHGQADQLRLRTPAAQRQALDSLGGGAHAALCRSYAASYAAWQQAAAELDRWRAGAEARAQEVARLVQGVQRIEELDPHAGEDAELTAEAARLDHAEDLRLGAGRAQAALVGSEDAAEESSDVVALLAAARRALEEVADLDPELAGELARLQRLSIDAADVAGELGEYLAGLDADPARLAWVQDRRGELARACRDLSTPQEPLEDADALLAAAGRWSERLAELDGPVNREEELAEKVAEARSRLDECARELTRARGELATRMEQEVSAELAGLQMKGARLVVRLEPLAEPGATGAETVSLLLVSHPGAPALPLGKGASGGELSRIMLAIEVVLADSRTEADSPEGLREPRLRRTLIFDEIDAGVGGRAAGEIGRRLARLARTHQVIVVTHLAQVAAWAQRQLVVSKQVESGPEGAVTRTSVRGVGGEDRVRELARMLSGHDASQAARQHAGELLAEAGMAQSTV